MYNGIYACDVTLYAKLTWGMFSIVYVLFINSLLSWKMGVGTTSRFRFDRIPPPPYPWTIHNVAYVM